MIVEKNKQKLEKLYDTLNIVSKEISAYLGGYTPYTKYSQNYSLPDIESIREFIRELQSEVDRLKIVYINDIPSDDFLSDNTDNIKTKLVFEGLEEITDEELIKLNYYRLIDGGKYFILFKNELVKKYKKLEAVDNDKIDLEIKDMFDETITESESINKL